VVVVMKQLLIWSVNQSLHHRISKNLPRKKESGTISYHPRNTPPSRSEA